MPRVKTNTARNKRKKKLMKEARGYFGGRSKLYRTAKDAVERGWQYAYRDRRQRKRDFRRLWIARINAAARQNDLSYSRFICGLRSAGVDLIPSEFMKSYSEMQKELRQISGEEVKYLDTDSNLDE